MKPPGAEGAPRIDVSCEELEALLEGVRPALGEAGYQKLQAAIRTLNYVAELLETREATLERLRQLLCHSSTEKTEKVLKQVILLQKKRKRLSPFTTIFNPSAWLCRVSIIMKKEQFGRPISGVGMIFLY